MTAGRSAGTEQGQGREVVPPLGLLPRWLVAEHRLHDVRRAVDRYAETGRAVPGEWLAELDDLVAYLDRYTSSSVPPARDSGRDEAPIDSPLIAVHAAAGDQSGRDEAREAAARVLARHSVYGFNGTQVLCSCPGRSWLSRAEHQDHLANVVAALLRDGTTT